MKHPQNRNHSVITGEDTAAHVLQWLLKHTILLIANVIFLDLNTAQSRVFLTLIDKNMPTPWEKTDAVWLKCKAGQKHQETSSALVFRL